MLSLLRLLLFMLLAIPAATGIQKVVRVSSSGSGERDCCVHGNCNCNSLNHALGNLTSNVLINITTDVMLSSLIKLSELKHVSIVGHNNPTVNRENSRSGTIHFTSCDNCTIHDIVWNGCGTRSKSVVKFSKSSNILISNCSFQYSVGQSVELSVVRGNVNIQHCNFLYSNQYTRHGASIYLSTTAKNSTTAICYCNFMHNKGAKSLVYIKSKKNNLLTLDYSKFRDNQGLLIYVVKSNIHVNGINLFQDNTANGEGAVYITNQSSIVFNENSEVSFIQNSVYLQGGVVVVKFHSSIVFDQNSTAAFYDNNANNGIVYSQTSSSIIFKANCKVTFNGNSAKEYDNINSFSQASGAAIFSNDNSYISFEENASIVFTNNTADWFGGAIYSHGTFISFEGNASALFTNNTAGRHGGAFYFSNTSVSLKGCSSTLFSKNNAYWYGGAIYLDDNCLVSFEGNSSTMFSNNSADLYGGAVYSNYSTIMFKGNSSTLFYDNVARILSGGAICSSVKSYLSFEENSSAVFNNNSATRHGGAIALSYTITYFKGTSFTLFSNNNANSVGGAIHSKNCSISFTANTATEFNNNTGNYEGGAVYLWESIVSFEGFSATTFNNNIADKGGALSIATISNINFFDDSTVMFMNSKGTLDITILSTADSKITAANNFTVIFNDQLPKWCNNECLPYSDAVKIQSDGAVWCDNPKAFTCLSKKCKCKKLENLLSVSRLKNNSVVNVTRDVTLSSVIELHYLTNISVIGHNNITVSCVDGGGLDIQHCSQLKIEGITWIGCGNHSKFPVISIKFPGPDMTIKNCTFQHSLARIIEMSYIVHDVSFNNCNFMNNNYSTIIWGTLWNDPNVNTDLIITININNCNFSYNGNKYLHTEAVLYFEYLSENLDSVNHVYLHNSRFHNNLGVSVHLPNKHDILHISGDVLFANNVAEDGAGIYISKENSYVIFQRNSIAKFINNSVTHSGAALFLNYRSRVISEQNSYVTFNDNKATSGTIYCKAYSSVIFTEHSLATFDGNSASQYGSAIYLSDNSRVTFTGNSAVSFINNNVVPSADTDLQLGGTIFSANNSHVLVEENSSVTFSNNSADFGTAVFSLDNSSITFQNHSIVNFTNNIAQRCGALTAALSSSIKLTGNTVAIFNANVASYPLNSNFELSAGAMCTFQRANVKFSGYSLVTFTKNVAHKSGTVAFSEANVILQDYSSIIFEDNIAQYSSAGALTCAENSNVMVKDNSNVTFNSNNADESGGAIHAYGMCKIVFKDNSTSSFIKNTARDNGGAIYSSETSEISFEGNSTVVFAHNTADNGGVFYFISSTLMFKETSTLLFYNNIARRSGGVGSISLGCIMMIKGSTTVEFESNMAEQNAGVLYCATSTVLFEGHSNTTFSSSRADDGGAISAHDHCNITLTENSVLLFTSNEAALSGGAGYFNHQCNFNTEENAVVSLNNNKAHYGGALCVENNTKLSFTGNSTTMFYNNLAIKDGGVIKALKESSITLKDHHTIKLSNSTASHGGAIFLDKTAVMIHDTDDDESLNFTNTTAKVLGNLVYQDVADSCSRSCLTDRVVGVSTEFIATPPKELKFYNPAICVDDDNDTQCNSYYVQNIMLGSDIVIPACVFDHYNHPMEPIPFLVQSEAHPYYSIGEVKQVVLSCTNLKGISITGNVSLSKSIKFSITVTLNTKLHSDWEQMSVNLITELSPCYPGFWQYPKSEKCECYRANDGIVFCSGSSSTIKRGYWFGSVTGKPTVTFCPINYCNFTCCDTSNGYYHLSPVRNNQCRSHRSGTACGSCMESYTLSFDSNECVKVEDCTAGQTVLVIFLTMTYWMAMIALLLGIMYTGAGIGYLYSITYYYSIIGILLNQNLLASGGLNLATTTISSFFTTTPLFLGKLCLAVGMGGIDQQFIHYFHPSALVLIVVIVRLLAEQFQRISVFIGWGKFRVVCFLLLLSYTSITSTSLLLIRSLTFQEIDNVYTYLSPDIEYFHGRHLVYGIVALSSIASIVFSLPLLLIVEPFLKHHVNFVRIKPFLDELQGCYKDKYHCFAGYYMICRLLIITIVIFNTPNELVANHMIIVVCGMTAFIHLTVKPYNKEILNTFDAVILHLIMFAAALSLLDDVDSLPVIATAFVLVLAPLLVFTVLILCLHKDRLRKVAKYITSRYDVDSNDEEPMKEYDLVIDDSIRKNITSFDIWS